MKQTMMKLINSTILLSAAIAGMAQAADAGRVVFVSGKVEMAGQNLALNNTVAEGAEISTGADGYVYLKTIDNGFFILRPNSRARIVAYHVDQTDPANTRIKFELLNGVARSISGDAVKLARQNFRFNTPVAAIGVRGTDFTVHTTQETSRVAVISGGIVVSGFVSGCLPQGNGPCEGGASAELFARQQGQLLQITKDQAKPQLIQSNGSAPDMVAPPRQDEPSGKSATAAVVSATVPLVSTDINLDPQKNIGLKQAISTPVPVVPTPVTPPVPPVVEPVASQIIWGRWSPVAGQPANIDLTKYVSVAKTIGLDSYLALFQVKGVEWQMPATGSMGFALKDSEAYVNNQTSGVVTTAKLQNASLNVDFAKTSFTTSFDLLTNNEIFKRQAQGKVYSDGQFAGYNYYPNNMLVNGVLTSEKGGSAAYLFQTRLDDNRVASGITIWGK